MDETAGRWLKLTRGYPPSPMTTQFRDRDVRSALDIRLRAEFRDDPDALIVHELGLSTGSVRIDIAVINGRLNGYEIKSPADTLERLPMQQLVYNDVLEAVTLVASNSHLDRAADLVPEWWGLMEISTSDDSPSLSLKRSPGRNPRVDPSRQVQLLWRDEALEILRQHGLEDGLRSKPRRDVWRRMVEVFVPDEISAFVRSKLKARTTWRRARLSWISDSVGVVQSF